MFSAAKWYDTIYRRKDYRSEANHIARYLKKDEIKAISVLDIGGGTGRHAYFLERLGFGTLVIDRDPEMLRYARDRGLQTLCDDIEDRHFPLESEYQNAIMLFHVFNFLTDKKAAFKNIRRLVQRKGRLIFDFWDMDRMKRNGWSFHFDWHLSRFVKKSWEGNTVKIDFYFLFLLKHETHFMDCPNDQEIQKLLSENGFRTLWVYTRKFDKLVVAEKI